MKTETDWNLITLSQNGDMDAFAEIYSRYVSKIFVFVLTRVRDPYLAEDFTSETFCRALRRIDSVTYEGTGVCAWLTIIARNMIYDHTKSAHHKLNITALAIPDFSDDHDNPEEAAVKTLAAIAAKQRVEQLLSQVRPDYRRCIELRFLQEMTHAEAAAAMDVKESVSKTWQRRAFKELAEIAKAAA